MITTFYLILVIFSTLVAVIDSANMCRTLDSPILNFANFYSAKDVIGFVIDSFAFIWATIQLEYVVRSTVLIFLPLLDYLAVQSIHMCSLVLRLNVKGIDDVYRLWFIGVPQGGEQALAVSTLTAVFMLFPRMSREKLLVTKNGVKSVPFSTMHIAFIWLANYIAKLVLGFYMDEVKLGNTSVWLMELLWNPYHALAPLHVFACMLVGILVASLQCKDVGEKRRIIKYQYMRFKWSGRLE